MEAGEGREKRVRKKTKRLSESACLPEEPAKKRRKRGEGVATTVSAASTTEHQKIKRREKKGDGTRKLIVSYNLAKHSLKLVSTSVKELKRASIRTEDTPTPTNSWNGEGAFPRRSAEVNFKNPNFSVSAVYEFILYNAISMIVSRACSAERGPARETTSIADWYSYGKCPCRAVAGDVMTTKLSIIYLVELSHLLSPPSPLPPPPPLLPPSSLLPPPPLPALLP